MPTTTNFTKIDDSSFPSGHYYTDVTIANGASQSGAVNLGVFTPVALQLPAAWTAAKVSFLASGDDSTFGSVVNLAGEVASAANNAASDYVILDQSTFGGLKIIKVRSGTSATPVNQGDDRTIRLIVKPIR